MSMQWFRLYNEFSTDPKVQSLSEALQRRLIMLFCLQSQGNLQKLTLEQLSYSLRISEKELEKTLKIFKKCGFINESMEISNWDKRQYVSDSSSARMARLREKKKKEADENVTSHIRHSDASVTPPEAEADTETEDINNCSSSIEVTTPVTGPAAANSIFLAELEKWFPNLNPANGKLFRMLASWHSAGVTQADIASAMACNATKRADIKAPWYFEKMVIEFATARKEGKDPPTRHMTNAEAAAICKARTPADLEKYYRERNWKIPEGGFV